MAAPQPAPPTPGLRDRWLYGSGVVNYALKDAAFGAFVMFYYKQVLGLSGTLTGFAIFISVMWDAISDPLVGAWSDRMRTRIGRRHPLMIVAVLPLALSFVMLFSAPESVQAQQWTLFAWLLASVLLLRTSLTLFMVPWLALGAEMSSDYRERSALASTRTHIGWFVGVLIPSTSLALLFQSSGGVDGRFLAGNYLAYGLLCAGGVVLASLVCLRGTWRYIPHLPGRQAHAGRGMIGDIVQVFRNRNFRLLVILDIAVGGLGGVMGALFMVTLTYFWELSTVQASIMFGGPPLLAIVLSSLYNHLWGRHQEKQRLLQFACVCGVVNLAWLTPLKLLGWLPDNDGVVYAIIFGQYALYVGFTILRTIANHSLLADVADEQELISGERQEGVMFAAAFFSAKFITGFGYLVGGPFLDLIGLQAGATPGSTPASVELGIGLVMGPGLALMMLIPVWMAFTLRLSREGTQQVQAALAQRRAAGN